MVISCESLTSNSQNEKNTIMYMNFAFKNITKLIFVVCQRHTDDSEPCHLEPCLLKASFYSTNRLEILPSFYFFRHVSLEPF